MLIVSSQQVVSEVINRLDREFSARTDYNNQGVRGFEPLLDLALDVVTRSQLQGVDPHIMAGILEPGHDPLDGDLVFVAMANEYPHRFRFVCLTPETRYAGYLKRKKAPFGIHNKVTTKEEISNVYTLFYY
jgi:hypothetical protein